MKMLSDSILLVTADSDKHGLITRSTEAIDLGIPRMLVRDIEYSEMGVSPNGITKFASLTPQNPRKSPKGRKTERDAGPGEKLYLIEAV